MARQGEQKADENWTKVTREPSSTPISAAFMAGIGLGVVATTLPRVRWYQMPYMEAVAKTKRSGARVLTSGILPRLMARILLLTNTQGASAEVLPSLGLLQHQVRVMPAEASILVDVPEVDCLFIDARREIPAAKSLTRLLQSTGVDCPIISITTEGGLSAMNADWGISDVILDTAGPAEVEARIRLVIGRFELDRVAADPSLREIRTGDIVIDENSYTAKVRGRTLDLTFKEFELLKFLAQHPGRVFTRAQLLQEIWGYDYFGGTRTVDVHIRRLRSKLGPEFEALIGTVRNVGYRFTLPNNGKENSLSELV